MTHKPIDAQTFIMGKSPKSAIKSFFIIGSEQFLMDKVNLYLRKELKARYNAEFVVVWGDELKVAELRDYLDSYSLFAETKVLLIRNADQMKAELLLPLVEYYSSPSEDQILIIYATSVDKRLSAWRTIIANSQTITCDPPKNQSDLGQWLDIELRSLKKMMNSDARQEFLERVELDFKTAENELQKIVILVGKQQRIELNDIITCLGSSRTNSIGDLYKALHTHQPGKIMEVIQNILETGGEAIPTLASIHRYFTNLWRIALLKKKKLSVEEIKRSYLHDFYDSYKEPFLKASEKYPLQRFERIFDILLDIDAKLKLTAADPKTLLTNCISRIYYKNEA